MTLKVCYIYETWTEGCGCCSDSASYIEFFDTEGEYWEEHCGIYCENEEELRSYLRDAHPDLVEYEVDEDSKWF